MVMFDTQQKHTKFIGQTLARPVEGEYLADEIKKINQGAHVFFFSNEQEANIDPVVHL